MARLKNAENNRIITGVASPSRPKPPDFSRAQKGIPATQANDHFIHMQIELIGKQKYTLHPASCLISSSQHMKRMYL